MADCVVDASAILALVKGEPGAGVVRARISRAVVSTVNGAEVGTKLVDWGMTGAGLRHVILNLGFEVRPFDSDQALAAAALRTATRSHGLSLGDRACLALGAALFRRRSREVQEGLRAAWQELLDPAKAG